MYGQMTAGSWIYIGTQGILQGTYETFAEARDAAVRRLARRDRDAHRRARRDGRRAAARRHDERRRRPLRRGRPGADRAPHRDAATSTARPTTSTRRCAGSRRRVGAARRRSIGLVGNCAEVLPELLRRGFAPDLVTDQTSAHDPLGGYVPADLSLEEADRLRGDDPAEYERRVVRVRWPARRGDGRVPGARRGRVRLRQQPAGGRRDRRARARARLRLPGVRAGVRPADVLRGQGPVPLGGALGRSRGHLEDRPRGRRALPGERAAAALARAGRGAGRVPGPAGAHLLARLRRAREGGPAVQRDGARAASSRRRS